MKKIISSFAVILMFVSAGFPALHPEPENEPVSGAGPVVVLRREGAKYAYPRWSRDGAHILFQSNETGSWQICIADRDGRNVRAVTHDNYNNYFSDWSPDNSQIAFVSDRGGDEDIYLVNADGTNIVNLTNNPERDIHPYWSPDGRKILFNSTRSDPAKWSLDIFEMNSDGTEVRQVTNGRDVESCARYSPLDSRILYLKMDYETKQSNVYTCNADGTGETKITSDSTGNGWPSWAPDGKRIVYSVVVNDAFALFLDDLNGDKRKQLTFPGPGVVDARAMISGENRAIVFNREFNDSTIAIMIIPADSIPNAR